MFIPQRTRQFPNAHMFAYAFAALSILLVACGGGDDKSSAGAVPPSSAGAPGADLIAQQREAEAQRASQSPTPLVFVPLAQASPNPTPTPAPPAYKLALLSSSCTVSRSGYTTCEGFVKNISNEPLRGSIQVVISWYDSNDVPQKSTTGYVKFNPLLVGQDGPWSTFDSDNPALKNYRIQFKESFGAAILTRDDRKP